MYNKVLLPQKKEKEVEAEIAEKAEEMGLVNESDNEDAIIEDSAGTKNCVTTAMRKVKK